MRPEGQNQPAKDSNLAQWAILENVKVSINLGLLILFSKVWQHDKELPHDQSYYTTFYWFGPL